MVALFLKLTASLFLGVTGFFVGSDPSASTLDLATPWAYGLIGAFLPFVLPYLFGDFFGAVFTPKIAVESDEPSRKD